MFHMASQVIRVLSAGLSALLAIQPLGILFAQERTSNAGHAIPAEAFRSVHERVIAEPGRRTTGLRPGPVLSHDELIAAVQQKIKYVFVIYQENRSFDSYFGTFPGANGLFSQAASQTPGFVQKIVNTDGTSATISPFRIGPQQYAAD